MWSWLKEKFVTVNVIEKSFFRDRDQKMSVTQNTTTPIPFNVLNDDILARYEWVIRDNLVVRDSSKVIPWMMILRFEHSILWIYIEQCDCSAMAAIINVDGANSIKKSWYIFWKKPFHVHVFERLVQHLEV